jgi:hypothetical protein
MNEDEIAWAETRYRLHPVLGPATRTLANLVEWTNANSDGWPYWRKPAQAAAKLMALIEQGERHDRGKYQGPRTPDVTVQDYKRALTPLKAFRTRQEKTDGPGRRPLFEIVEPGKGVGGEVWAAEQAYNDAAKLYEEASARCSAVRSLRDRAMSELNHARYRQNWRDLADRESVDVSEARLVALGKPGTRLWSLPRYEVGGYRGRGEPATALGVVYEMSGSCIAFVTDSGREKHLFPAVVMTLAEARERWWVTDADGVNLVSGGHRDRERMERLVADKHPGCVVRQGAEFITEGG